MNAVLNFSEISKRVEKVLRDEFGPNTTVRTDEGWQGRVHAKVVSTAFDGRSEDEKQEMVWSVLRERLGSDAQHVSLVLAYGMDEI